MKIGINHASENFDHTVLAEVISSRWREDRPFFTLNREARGARLDASWLQQPANSALELHWSRRGDDAEATPRWTFSGLVGPRNARQLPHITQYRSNRPCKRLTDNGSKS